MFSQCLDVYPLAIGIAERGYSDQLSAEEVIAGTLKKLVSLGIRIRHLIPDHPKRCGETMYMTWSKIFFGHAIPLKIPDCLKILSELRLQKTCASYYGCDLCFARVPHLYDVP